MKYTLTIFSSLSLLSGILFFLIHHEWIIIRHPYNTQSHMYYSTPAQTKKIIISIWTKKCLATEYLECVWHTNREQNIYYIVTHWIALMEEEHALDKKITLQTVMISPSQCDIFLSFDRNFLPKQASIYSKLMIIESLLKTIRDNEPSIQNVYFLVQHNPLQDYHLDFSQPWPINGFTTQGNA